MSKQTANNLFINSSLPRFYQQLLGGIESYQELGNRIIRKIKAAHAFRQVEQVRELSRILINIPVKEYQLIAQYYLLWCDCRESNFHNVIFERLAEQTWAYKAKALLSRAAVEGYQGKTEPELYFYSEALKATSTISDYVEASRCIAIVESKEGFHTSALRDLKSIIPFIRHAEPLIYYDFLNSYAVELSAAGYKQESRNIIRYVLESPFAFAYPEWQDTADELRAANRSFAVIRPTRIRKAKLLVMPQRQHDEPTTVGRLAPVIPIQEWKEEKMAKKKKGNGNPPVEDMDLHAILLRSMQVFADMTISEEKKRRMMFAIEKILAEPDPPKTDEDA